MSYDVEIGSWEGNYTHNSLGDLCYKHLDINHGLKTLDGLTGYEAAPLLRAFWERVNEERNTMWKKDVVGEPDFCAKYDSPNGWGSLVGAITFMGELTAACALFPKGMIRVWA